MVFTNITLTTTIILNHFTMNVTGSQFLSYFLIMMVILIFAAAFRIPIEWTIIIIFPILLVLAAWQQGFMALFIVILSYLAILFAKNFFFRQ